MREDGHMPRSDQHAFVLCVLAKIVVRIHRFVARIEHVAPFFVKRPAHDRHDDDAALELGGGARGCPEDALLGPVVPKGDFKDVLVPVLTRELVIRHHDENVARRVLCCDVHAFHVAAAAGVPRPVCLIRAGSESTR